jgi:aspartate kinase
MKVMKFGGTSVKDATLIRQVEQILKQQNEPVLIVVSAVSGVTNLLVSILDSLNKKDFTGGRELITRVDHIHTGISADLGVSERCSGTILRYISLLNKVSESIEILGEITPKTKDLVMATGELLSAKIIFEYLRKKEFPVIFADPGKILITDNHFNEADVVWEATRVEINSTLAPIFEKHQFVITGGFTGTSTEGHITTLGRGGSDYSAAIFASLLKADSLEIWTDVDGILTCDPRIVSNARYVPEVTYAEASELAYFGAKVLHPKTIFPAVQADIPVYVRNTFNPGFPGTRIVSSQYPGKSIKAIAFRKNITLINITSNRMLGAYGFLAKVFQVFDLFRTPVDLISTSEVSISCTIDNTLSLDAITKALSEISTVQVFHDKAIISAIGEGIRSSKGMALRFFSVLQEFNISLVTMGASEINLSIVLDSVNLDPSLKALHKEFFEQGY